MDVVVGVLDVDVLVEVEVDEDVVVEVDEVDVVVVDLPAASSPAPLAFAGLLSVFCEVLLGGARFRASACAKGDGGDGDASTKTAKERN